MSVSEKSLHLLRWWGLFLSSLLPFGYIAYQAFWGDLGTDPAKTLVQSLGKYALIMLLVVLTVTPLARLRVVRLTRYRRMLGLFVFFYASLHLFSYIFILADWSDFVDDLSKRLYIFVGALAYLILVVLAVTSLKKWVRRLGTRWKRIHRTIYLVVILVLLHFIWQARADLTVPAAYSFVAVVLLSLRPKEVMRLLSGR